MTLKFTSVVEQFLPRFTVLGLFLQFSSVVQVCLSPGITNIYHSFSAELTWFLLSPICFCPVSWRSLGTCLSSAVSSASCSAIPLASLFAITLNHMITLFFFFKKNQNKAQKNPLQVTIKPQYSTHNYFCSSSCLPSPHISYFLFWLFFPVFVIQSVFLFWYVFFFSEIILPHI